MEELDKWESALRSREAAVERREWIVESRALVNDLLTKTLLAKHERLTAALQGR
jgi:hypothetical protein